MGGCLSSSPGAAGAAGAGAAAALAVKGPTYATTGNNTTEDDAQQHSSIHEQKQQHQQQAGKHQQGAEGKEQQHQQSMPGVQCNHVSPVIDGTAVNSAPQKCVGSTPSTPIAQPGSSVRPPEVPSRGPTSTSTVTELSSRPQSNLKTAGSDVAAQQDTRFQLNSTTTMDEAMSSTSSARPATHAEKSAAAAAKKPRSLKSRLLAAANLETFDRDSEPGASYTCSANPQGTADSPAPSSPFATPANKTPYGGSAATGGYPSSRSSSHRAASAALTATVPPAPGLRAPSSKAIAAQNFGAASALMSQVESRLIEAEQLLGQQRPRSGNAKRQGDSESSLSKPEANRPPTREEMMRQLDLAEKKLMGMRKEGGSGY